MRAKTKMAGYSTAGVFTALLGVLGAEPACAQATRPANAAGVQELFDKQHRNAPQEKLFLHLDRDFYVGGDIMWFKAYAVAARSHLPLPLSKVAYVEVLDQRQKPVLQAKIALKDAVGHGSLHLPATLETGRYTVRAYTNWMKNFGPDSYFHSTISVVNTFAPSLPKSAADSLTIDAQLFAEGGNLVKGLKSRLAFKLTDRSGKGIDAQGALLNARGEIVTRIATLRFGMGSVDFVPDMAGEQYTAVFNVNNKLMTRRVPAVQERGYVMRLDQSSTEHFIVTVQATGLDASATSVHLLGHTREQAFAAQDAWLTQGQAQFLIKRSTVPAGIVHFTLFNADKQPVCERLAFQQPKSKLELVTKADKNQFTTREKVSLNLTALSPARKPVASNLSVAVYRLDSLTAGSAVDISSSLWLTSELRGLIEQPSYYLSGSGEQVRQATDNLMLTQGWRRFNWENMLTDKTQPLEFTPELNGHLVQARVRNRLTGAPADGITAYMAAPGQIVRLYNATSKAGGRVQFETKFSGLNYLVLQTNARQDSTYQFEILNPFSKDYSPLTPLQPALLTGRLRNELTRRHLQAQTQNAYFRKQNSFYAAPLADSTAFYGKPDERYRLDDYTRFKVLEEVMREYVAGVQVRIRRNGYHFQVANNQAKTFFEEDPMVLLDGVPVFNINKLMKLDPLKVRKVEVVTSRYLQGPQMYTGIVSFTTYKGDMGGLQPQPGTLVEQYEGLQWEREFYAPRYETEQQKQSRLPDLRHLLYWNPYVLTATAGAKQVEFYTGDEAGKYLVVVQGLTPTGLSGSGSFTFDVLPTGVAQAR